MYRTTIDLLNRVEALVNDHGEFFAATREWYGDAALANQAVRLLLARSSTGARIALAVNGQQLAGEAVTVAPDARALRWVLAPVLLIVGDNDVTVSVEPRSGRNLYLRSGTVSQEGALPEQILAMNRHQPVGTAYLALAGSRIAAFDGDVWKVQPGGGVTLRLRLQARAPVTLVLSLLNETVKPKEVFDSLKEVVKRVRTIREQLAEERDRVGRSEPDRIARLERNIADLDTYLQLHTLQIEPALRGADTDTLQGIIARTGDPDRLVEDNRPYTKPRRVPHAVPEGPAPAPGRPRAPRPEKEPASSSSGLSCLAGVVGVLLVLGGIGYATWSVAKIQIAALQGETGAQRTAHVEISSLAEGQTVAPNAPLQVWVLAVNPTGVESVALTVETAGGASVVGVPDPQRITFPPGTKEPGSSVFIVNVGPLRGANGTLTLTATMVTHDGKTITDRRTVTVGGAAEDLQWEIIPKQPRPTDLLVTVVVRMVNARPGAKIGYTLRGTDFYTQPVAGAPSLVVGEDGTVRFTVPCSVDGVIDKIEAWIEGTTVRRTTQYEFRSVGR